MPDLAELSHEDLIQNYYDLHDQLGCAVCGGPVTASPDKVVIANEIFRRHFAWLGHGFYRYRAVLTEEPQALAVIVIWKALRTECRRKSRYDPTRGSFRTWLARIAQRVRLDHSMRRAIRDVELLQQWYQARDEAKRESLREELEDHYREILTNWFRRGCKGCGLSTRPEDVKILVDDTFDQVFARIGEFDPDETAFIVWLSRIAKAVLASHGIQPIRELPGVPECVGRQDIELDEEVPATGDPPGEQFTDPRFVKCWQKLTPMECQVLGLVDVKGLDPEEAAKRLGVDKGTVYNNHSSGKRKLKECLS